VVSLPSGLLAALPVLRCPQCRDAERDLAVVPAGSLRCELGHSFDVARQGSVTLLAPGARTDTGDNPEMVAARSDFFAGGWYAPLVQAVAEATAAGLAATGAARSGAVLSGSGLPGAVLPGAVLELGAGPGQYLAAALAGVSGPAGGRAGVGESVGPVGPVGPVGIALDASRAAARRAARSGPRIAAVVADAWAPLPVRTEAVDVVLSVFAPRAPAEVVRVLRPGGRFVVVTPEPGHLAELRSTVPLLAVPAGKADAVAVDFAGALRPLERRSVRRSLALPPTAVRDLVAMGPTARHLPPDALAAAVAGLPGETTVTLAVTVTVLERSA
jgi:23S rRNA (guanine745-N1)-methyltransferase